MVSVGVVPQSESLTAASKGSCQWSTTAMVVALMATSAWESVCEYRLSVPVETKILLVAASYVGDVQIPPPTCPVGTIGVMPTTWWVASDTFRSWPWTSGASQTLAVPM